MARGIIYGTGIVTMFLLAFVSVVTEHANLKAQAEKERTQQIIDELAHQCGSKYPQGGDRLQECIDCAMAQNDL